MVLFSNFKAIEDFGMHYGESQNVLLCISERSIEKLGMRY